MKDSNTSMSNGSSKAAARIMMRTLFSTTFRIFVPTTVLFLIGLAIDLNTPARPWGMAIGTSIGIIIAAILVFLQLKAIRQDNQQLKVVQGEK